MKTAYFCVFAAAFLPYVFAGYAKFSKKGYDNRNPREFLEKLEGKGRRANYVQLNSFEAFPAFAAGVIIAQLAGVSSQTITVLAVSFVLLRILYGICYVADHANARTLFWFAGFLCMAALYFNAISASL